VGPRRCSRPNQPAVVSSSIEPLGPRALANHRWYRETFPDYPPDRKALVPFVL
jgi:hypothetical protein